MQMLEYDGNSSHVCSLSVRMKRRGVIICLQGQLEACNSLRYDASLYQSEVSYHESDYDTVDKSIQSSRHVDVFKVWLMWRAKGPQGYEAQIEQLMELSKYDSALWAQPLGGREGQDLPEICTDP